MREMKDEGRTMYFPDADTHFTSLNKKRFPVWRNYQQDRLDKAYNYVTDFSVAVDAGAHVGLLTQRLAERFTLVYAFEPDPHNFECLEANTRHLPNVRRFQLALGRSQLGAVGLDRGDGTNSGNIQIQQTARAATHCGMTCVDHYDFGDLGLFKLDVQGYEAEVLRGAQRHIMAYAPAMIVECEPPGKLTNQQAGDQVAAFMGQNYWDVRLEAVLSADRIYVPGPNGVKPYTKYAARGDYHWQRGPTSGMDECLSRCVAYIKGQQHATILDVGCGDGFVAHHLGAFGIDDNAVAIALARQHNISCVQLSLYRAHHLGRRFDAAIMFDVLEHMPLQESALRAVGRVTDTLYILNPDPVGKHWHTHEFTEVELVEFVQTQGWTVRHSQRFDMSARNKKTFLYLTKNR